MAARRPKRNRTSSARGGASKSAKKAAKKAAKKPTKAAKKSAKKTSKTAGAASAKKTKKRSAAKKAARKPAKASTSAAKKSDERDAKRSKRGARSVKEIDAARKVSSANGKSVAAKVGKKEKSDGAAVSKSGKSSRTEHPDKTIPGGSAPAQDPVVRVRQLMRELRLLLEQASDPEVEAMIGDGGLEAILGSIVPPIGSAQVHEHLAQHKRRASLLARIRHRINAQSAFMAEGRFVSPARAQWFYDGLTFLEGEAPYEGVVGFYRDGVVRYGVGVADAAKGDSMGPMACDFVSVAEARRSFRAAAEAPARALERINELRAVEATEPWIELFHEHPWLFGAQHSAIVATSNDDPDWPRLTGKRSSDSALDVFVVAAPSTPIVGKTSRVLVGFKEIWSKAERLRIFVQRQADFFKREQGWKVRDPRFFVVAGRCTAEERQVVRNELEAHFSAIRLVTYDELQVIGERTLSFFQPRL